MGSGVGAGTGTGRDADTRTRLLFHGSRSSEDDRLFVSVFSKSLKSSRETTERLVQALAMARSPATVATHAPPTPTSTSSDSPSTHIASTVYAEGDAFTVEDEGEAHTAGEAHTVTMSGLSKAQLLESLSLSRSATAGGRGVVHGVGGVEGVEGVEGVGGVGGVKGVMERAVGGPRLWSGTTCSPSTPSPSYHFHPPSPRHLYVHDKATVAWLAYLLAEVTGACGVNYRLDQFATHLPFSTASITASSPDKAERIGTKGTKGTKGADANKPVVATITGLTANRRSTIAGADGTFADTTFAALTDQSRRVRVIGERCVYVLYS